MHLYVLGKMMPFGSGFCEYGEILDDPDSKYFIQHNIAKDWITPNGFQNITFRATIRGNIFMNVLPVEFIGLKERLNFMESYDLVPYLSKIGIT